MPYKNAFFKALLGHNAQVLISKAVAYTTDATFDLFVANAVEGEIGIYDANDNSLFDGLSAAADTDLIFIALKRDGLVETSTPFKLKDLTLKKTAYSAPQKQSTTLTLAGSVATGDVFELAILDTTPANQPFPTYNYQVKAASGETLDTLGDKFAALVNDTASKANKDRDLIVTATYNSGTNVLTLAAIDYGVTFRVQVRQKLVDVATIAYPTPMKLGSGFAAHVRLLQDAGDIYKGVTTNYPNQGANPEDFGKPTDFVSDALNYNLYDFVGVVVDGSKTPHKVQHFDRNITLAIPTAGGPDTAVSTILGV